MCKRLYTRAEQMVIRNFKSRSGNVCGYCGKHLADNNRTIDHKTPHSRGGKTSIANLVIACECCNRDKADMTEAEYINYLQIKNSRIEKNNTLRTIRNLIEDNENMNSKRMNTMKLLETTVLRRKEIESYIESENFSASQGYKLCKELKDAMMTITKLKAECHNIVQLITTVQQDNIILNATYKDLLLNVMKDIRTKMNIGNIARLEAVS